MIADQPDAVDLRALTPGDANVMAGWADPTFCARACWNPQLSYEERVEFWAALIEYPPVELLRLAVIQDRQVVGYIDLHGLQPLRRELGFVIGGRQRWGQGLGTRAASAALTYGFDHMSLQQIWAEALDANQASISILQRIGMAETGRGKPEKFLGRPTHYRQFAITADEWGLWI